MKFYTKPLIRFSGSLLLILLEGLPLYALLIIFDQGPVKEAVLMIAILAGAMILGGVILHKHYWAKCFSTLIVTEKEIIWKCPFRKKLSLDWDECKYIGVQLEESYNGLPYPFIFFSNKPYPSDFYGKIDQLSCKRGFIKFWYSEELCDYLVTTLPGHKAGSLLHYRIKSRKTD